MAEENGFSKLDNLSKDDLIKLVKKYIILQKTLKNKNEELTNKLKTFEDNKLEVASEDSSVDKLKELEKVKDELDLKIAELNRVNQDLNHENTNLKSNIENLDVKIKILKDNLKTSEEFQLNLEPQLENAQREIELNKSMLLMLNNEINVINSEKLQLEKKLLSTRRKSQPSVIIEEEEEDLVEEQEQEEKNGTEIIGHFVNSDSMKLSNDRDVDFLLQNGKNTDGILVLNKQIEDMTFYIDELKSELETEREKNTDLTNELFKSNEKVVGFEARFYQLEKKKQTSEDKNESPEETNNNEPLNQDKQKEKEENYLSKEPKEPTVKISEEIFENKKLNLVNYLNIIKEDLIEKESFEQVLKNLDDQLSKDYNDATDIEVNKKSIEGLIEKYKAGVEQRENSIREKTERGKNIENQMEKLVKDFKTENDKLEILLSAKTSELNNFKNQTETKLKALQTDLDNEKERTKNLATYEKEKSKNKMLDLEIANYEKTIKSLNVQIISKDKEINDVKAELTSTTEKLVKLKEDLSSMESEKDKVEEKNTKLKQLLVKAKKDVSDAKAHEAQHLSTDASLKSKIEAQNIEIESFKLQVADLSFERQRLHEKLQQINENGQRTIQLLESKMKIVEDELKESKNKYNETQTEFDKYKLKAQHAFKKQKEQNDSTISVASNNEIQKYLSEIENLKLLTTKLTDELRESIETYRIMEKDYDVVQDEYAKCLDRNTSLLTELKEKELEWKFKNQELLRESTLKSEEAIDIIRDLKLQNEAQLANFKEKVKQLKAQNNESTNLLQSQLEESKLQIIQLNKEIEDLIKNSPRPMSPNSNYVSSIYRQESHSVSLLESVTVKNNFILGVSANSNNLTDHEKSNNKEAKTIEELLLEASPTHTNSANDAKFLKDRSDLNKAKLQLEHLNELLNESELNNVRLSEQINVLKDEIRRLERNQEREKSISNMEYLKNVVLKFLSFSSIQEREQLLPVLSTMLKLNKDEQNLIMNAKVSSL